MFRASGVAVNLGLVAGVSTGVTLVVGKDSRLGAGVVVCSVAHVVSTKARSTTHR